MKFIFRTYQFWIVFFIASLASTYGVFRLFPHAFSILHLNITMNRSEALAKASALAKKYKLGPSNPQQAALFYTDNTVKTFVELEAGGKDALVSMMKQKLYEPYRWQVRQCKEFDVNEVTFSFTPEGTPYGFTETLSEEAPGKALPSEQALQRAKHQASQEWNVDFSQYALIDSSKEVKQSGRIDHTFVFERAERIGQGFYRLTLEISGDKLTKVLHSVKVPEAFNVRYQEMRSANLTIANSAVILSVILYIICGCFIGLFFLFRHNWVIWKQALYWALFLSTLSFIDAINELPLEWFSYDTAINRITFLVQYLLNAVVDFFFGFPHGFLFFFIVFVAAESLTRRALKEQPQFWKSWSIPVASSYGIAGRTLGGYFLVPFDLLYMVLFSLLTRHYLNWWLPSQSLFDPDSLATYFPWFHSIAQSLKAGFMEECFFRAIPLAGAIILIKKVRPSFRMVAFGAAFLIQALIFGAVHANYPGYPAYSRLIELILPSFIWGFLYLRFGLIPCIISHYLYDVVLFSLPLFISTAPGILLNRAMVIICSFIPLLVVLYARLKSGSWHELLAAYFNYSWKAPTLTSDQRISITPTTPISLSRTTRNNMLIAGTLGLCFLLMNISWKDDATRIHVTRNQAIEQAEQAFSKQGVDLSGWYPMTDFFAHFKDELPIQTQHRFVWREGGKEAYQQLLNTYLYPPYWYVKFGRFSGNVNERTRQYHAYITDTGIIKTAFTIPEDDKGVPLTEEQARNIAYKTIQKRYNLSASDITEISAQSEKQPHRLDWIFTFADRKQYPLQKGQARISVNIAGDKVIDTLRFVYVPEEWERQENNRTIIAKNISRIIGLLIYLLFIIGLFAAAYRLTQRHAKMSMKTLLVTTIVLSTLFLFDLALTWPQVVAKFNTTEPFFDQVLRTYSFTIILTLIKSAFLAMMIVFINSIWTRYCFRQTSSIFSMGISLGLVIAGARKIIGGLFPSFEPTWANYAMLDNFLPIANGTILYFSQFFYLTLFFLLWTVTINMITDQWKQRKLFGSFLIFLLTLLVLGLQNNEHITLWLSSTILIGIILWASYIIFVRFDIRIIPIATATFYSMILLQQGLYDPFSGSRAIVFSSILCIWIACVIWIKHLIHPEFIKQE